MILIDSWPALIARRQRVPPPEPPLGELGDSMARTVTPARATDQWPDPYGPDPVVFGSAPRVREPWCD